MPRFVLFVFSSPKSLNLLQGETSGSMAPALNSRSTVQKNWEICFFSQKVLSSSKSESEIADWQSETSDPCLLDWTVGTRYQKTGKPVCLFFHRFYCPAVNPSPKSLTGQVTHLIHGTWYMGSTLNNYSRYTLTWWNIFFGKILWDI